MGPTPICGVRVLHTPTYTGFLAALLWYHEVKSEGKTGQGRSGPTDARATQSWYPRPRLEPC